MKVPYLKKKIGDEYLAYLSEFKANITSRLALLHNEAAAKSFFSDLYPLFVLLRCLAGSEYMRDPARDTVLLELRAAGKKADFLNAIAYFCRRQRYRSELVLGLQKQTFTGYFEELFSDSLLLLNSFCTCNYRGAFVAIRCMLEDLYRHLYYRDHQQEFWALGQETAWDEYSLGITPQKLRDSLSSTEYLSIFRTLNIEFNQKHDGDMDLFGTNAKLYGECSRFVHGSSASVLSGFKSNADLMPNVARAEDLTRVTRQFVGLAVSFLVAAHIDHFMAFGEYERSLVLHTFDKRRRAAFRRALNI